MHVNWSQIRIYYTKWSNYKMVTLFFSPSHVHMHGYRMRMRRNNREKEKRNKVRKNNTWCVTHRANRDGNFQEDQAQDCCWKLASISTLESIVKFRWGQFFHEMSSVNFLNLLIFYLKRGYMLIIFFLYFLSLILILFSNFNLYPCLIYLCLAIISF